METHQYPNNPGVDLTWPSIKKYFSTRFTTLIPSREEIKNSKVPINPFSSLKSIKKEQWNFIMVGTAGWIWDGFDFFAVGVNVKLIAKSLNVSNYDISWGITLVLMFRSVGAAIFGLLGDRFGRKWPYIVNLMLLSIIQIGTGFVTTYKQFLAVRALFGVAMGGVLGNASALCLDDSPIEARGELSGILQGGYAFGYLLVVIFNRIITVNSSHSWRALFWFSSGPPVLIIIWRMLLPETKAYIAQKAERKFKSDKTFTIEMLLALKSHWLIIVYMVLLIGGFQFMAHGSQDLYPTLLSSELDFNANKSTLVNSMGTLGCVLGGVFMTHLSSIFGRRFITIICCILGGACIYPWAFVKSEAIAAGAFFLQFFVGCNMGITIIHLSELSPPHFRSFVVGTAYQLGNLAASASSTIEATIGSRFPLYDKEGNVKEGMYQYSLVMAIFLGCSFGYVILITFLGPENRDTDLVQVHEDIRIMAEKGLLEPKESGDLEEVFVYEHSKDPEAR